MKKKMISFIVMMVLLLTSMTGAFAVNAVAETSDGDSEIVPLYDSASYVHSFLSISSGTANCKAKINGYSDVTKIVVTMTLQKKSTLFWSTTTSWTETYYATTAYLYKLYGGLSSGTYRVKSKFVVYTGSSSETITMYSSEVAY